MTSETPPHRRSPTWAARQTVAAVGVAAVIGGLGGAAIYAATEGTPHTMGGASHTVGGPPPAPAQPTPSGALHSEYVVSDGHGGYTTKLTQTGTVDEVTLSSVVVRSADGYTQIYRFPSAATGSSRSVAANDTITVEATRTGPTVTLTSIGEGPPHGN